MESISNNLNDIKNNPLVLDKINSIQTQKALNDDNYDFLKSEIVSFRNLEMTLWYELISEVSNEDKVKNIFASLRTNLVERCNDLAIYLKE